VNTPPESHGPQPDAVRASDADRERVATRLRDSYADGRLTFDELQERLDQAYAGKTLGELQVLTSDLPAPQSPASVPLAPKATPPSTDWKRKRDRVLAYVVLMVFLIGIWAASGMHGSFWPIWPILIGGFAVARDVLGLSHGGPSGHGRRMERHQERVERHRRRMDRRR
jgi:Domain of unknown function (DUF1707)